MFGLAPVVLGAIAVVAVMVLISTVRALTVIVSPNMAAIITGRHRQLATGRNVGYRVVIGGRTLRIPIIEEVKWMPLSTIPIELSVHNAFSKGGIPLSVQAVANIKVASEPEVAFNNAVERLLGKGTAQIEALAKETLSANLRGVLATLTPEEVNEDRLRFAEQLTQEADQDLHKLGLQLDTLKIQNVSDEVGYLAAVGRVKTAEVLKQAKVAEAENEAATRQRQAEMLQQAEVAQARAEVAISEAKNTLRVRQAQLAQEGETTERVAKVEAQRAETEAQQALETQRIELQKRRLQADVVLPAEAERTAAEARARAAAAPILENGKAQVEVLKLLYAQIQTAGDKGYAVFMAEKLPALLGTAVAAVKDIDVDRLVILDGGSGDGVGNAANQRVQAALRLIEGLGGSLGIDLEQVLQSAASGRRFADRNPGIVAVQSADEPKPGR